MVNEPEEDHYGEDDMPELFDTENREEVDFDLFDTDSEKSARFKNSLLCFENVENHFFYAIIYGLMHYRLKGQNVLLENVKETLGEDFFVKLKENEKIVMLDHYIFGFFDRCCLTNNVLCEHGYFLRFYERRNKFRYQLRQKLKEKNEMRKELSACAIQKFHGYGLLRNYLNSVERKDFVPIDIVYEPTLDDKNPIVCFYCPHIYLGFHTTIEKLKNGKRALNHTGARQDNAIIATIILLKAMKR